MRLGRHFQNCRQRVRKFKFVRFWWKLISRLFQPSRLIICGSIGNLSYVSTAMLKMAATEVEKSIFFRFRWNLIFTFYSQPRLKISSSIDDVSQKTDEDTGVDFQTFRGNVNFNLYTYGSAAKSKVINKSSYASE